MAAIAVAASNLLSILLPLLLLDRIGAIAGLQRDCSLRGENFGMNFARGVERRAQSLMRNRAFSLRSGNKTTGDEARQYD
jgi:hypothetical protein